MKNCKVKNIFTAQPVTEGAGVRLKRVFGYHQVPAFDPFLLLDEFKSDDPKDYMAGFPRHPHRGIETVTYLLKGRVEHSDSLGNKGVIGPGDIQWMTAGSGIIHQEMPREGDANGTGIHGFQLWVNLAAVDKMSPPAYRDISADTVPLLEEPGLTLRLIAGTYKKTTGPARDISGSPFYADMEIEPDKEISWPVNPEHSPFVYVFQGSGIFSGRELFAGQAAAFESGDTVPIQASGEGLRFLLAAGRPLKEPVAWYGPIVMNTEAELQTAMDEYNSGRFIKI